MPFLIYSILMLSVSNPGAASGSVLVPSGSIWIVKHFTANYNGNFPGFWGLSDDNGVFFAGGAAIGSSTTDTNNDGQYYWTGYQVLNGGTHLNWNCTDATDLRVSGYQLPPP